jgi:hypothetical protein
MNNTLSEVAAGITTGVSGDDQLTLSADLRNLMAKAILSTGRIEDPQIANVALAALKANDQVVLAQKRLAVEKDAGDNNAAAIIAASLNLKAQYGHNMVPDEDMALIPKTPRPELSSEEFKFSNGESIIGVDTEDALNGQA